MRVQRAWKVVGAGHQAQIEQLQLGLAELNRRIAEVEKAQSKVQTAECLKIRATDLAWQIDQLRCAIATEQLACKSPDGSRADCSRAKQEPQRCGGQASPGMSLHQDDAHALCTVAPNVFGRSAFFVRSQFPDEE